MQAQEQAQEEVPGHAPSPAGSEWQLQVADAAITLFTKLVFSQATATRKLASDSTLVGALAVLGAAQGDSVRQQADRLVHTAVQMYRSSYEGMSHHGALKAAGLHLATVAQLYLAPDKVSSSWHTRVRIAESARPIAGVQRSCYAVLLQLALAAQRQFSFASALTSSAAILEILQRGLTDTDSLVRKRGRRVIADLVAVSAKHGELPDAAWQVVQEAWQHWLALYDSLDSYAVQLLQGVWRAHLPPLLALLPELQQHSDSLPPLLTLVQASGNALALESSAASAAHVWGARCTFGWMCVLFERALAHDNSSVLRFAALRVLSAVSHDASELRLPWQWVASRLARALMQQDVTPGALNAISGVCSPRPGTVAFVF
jgi:hypothetical protein